MSHSHDHHHHHHDHSAHEVNFNSAFALAVGLNLVFTLVEAFYAFMANSMGLLADAGHNLGDVAGLLLAWGANWLLSKPATARYSYGYRRTTVLASMANALLLVATSTLIAYESISKLLHPVMVNEKIIIIVAAIGIIINGGTALLFLRGRKEDLNIKGAYLHLAADALISVGVVVAGFLVYFTGWNRLDPIVGLLIVIAILTGTWGLLKQSFNLLLDAVPQHIDREGVYHYLQKISGISAIHDLHIWGLSTKEVAMTVHLTMPEKTLTDEDYQRINHDLLHDFNIHHVTIQVEKGHGDPCSQEESCY